MYPLYVVPKSITTTMWCEFSPSRSLALLLLPPAKLSFLWRPFNLLLHDEDLFLDSLFLLPGLGSLVTATAAVTAPSSSLSEDLDLHLSDRMRVLRECVGERSCHYDILFSHHSHSVALHSFGCLVLYTTYRDLSIFLFVCSWSVAAPPPPRSHEIT